MPSRFKRKANTALGVMVICLMFFFETGVAHYARPNPLSGLVWSMLGTTMLVAVVAWFWFSAKARRAAQAEERAAD